MPAIKSAKKKLRVDKKRTSANKKMEALINVSIKKAKKKPTPKSIQEAFSNIDKGVKKNIFHKNKAARIKSRLSKLINKKSTTTKTASNVVKARKPAKKTKKSSK